MSVPWYVITGRPSSGKTTLIKRLSDLGYATVPETARSIIDESLSNGISVEELRADERRFQESIVRRKLDVEANTRRDRLTFFDRGLPDSIAFYKVYGLDPSEVENVSRNRYRLKVFFLEQLPFEKDYARKEDTP